MIRPQPRRGTPANLAVIRIAMLGGVLAFGAAVFFLRRNGEVPETDAERLRAIRLVGQIIWATATAGVVALRLRYNKLRVEAARRTTSVIAWALGEMVAFFGGAYYFMTGDPRWYIAGLVFMLAAMILLPGQNRD